MNKIKQFCTDLVNRNAIVPSSEDEVLRRMIREAVNKAFNTDNNPVIHTSSMKEDRLLKLQLHISIKEEFIESLVDSIYSEMKRKKCLHSKTIDWGHGLHFNEVN